MKWNNGSQDNQGKFTLPEEWLYLHYYEALSVLFRVENALRMFVYVVLKDALQEKWADYNITSDDAAQATIASTARKRKAQDDAFGYLGYPTGCPFMHLTSGELIRLILSDGLWKHFRDHFPASRDLVKTKLDEIGNVRNSLAHFRALKPEDVQLVKQNASHILTGVEAVLVNLISSTQPVPTNTEEEWYKQLSVVGLDICPVRLFQSADDNWVRIGLEYKSPQLSITPAVGTMRYARTLKLLSPAVLKEFPVIANNVIYLSEVVPFVNADAEGNSKPSKTLSMVFSRSLLASKHAELKPALEGLLRHIASETELIQKDNLARGKLVSAGTVVTHQVTHNDKTWWAVRNHDLACPVNADDPPEYWGGFDHYYGQADLLSACRNYPWMPVEVSRWDFF